MAAAVFYYGTTSEVAWLFLLAYWIAALIVAAYVYARWNWRGLRADLGVGGARPGPDSPIETLPEQLLRSGPLPAPLFEAGQADTELRLTPSGGSPGPAPLAGSPRAVGGDPPRGGGPRAAGGGGGWEGRRVCGERQRPRPGHSVGVPGADRRLHQRRRFQAAERFHLDRRRRRRDDGPP